MKDVTLSEIKVLYQRIAELQAEIKKLSETIAVLSISYAADKARKEAA